MDSFNQALYNVFESLKASDLVVTKVTSTENIMKFKQLLNPAIGIIDSNHQSVEAILFLYNNDNRAFYKYINASGLLHLALILNGVSIVSSLGLWNFVFIQRRGSEFVVYPKTHPATTKQEWNEKPAEEVLRVEKPQKILTNNGLGFGLERALDSVLSDGYTTVIGKRPTAHATRTSYVKKEATRKATSSDKKEISRSQRRVGREVERDLLVMEGKIPDLSMDDCENIMYSFKIDTNTVDKQTSNRATDARVKSTRGRAKSNRNEHTYSNIPTPIRVLSRVDSESNVEWDNSSDLNGIHFTEVSWY